MDREREQRHLREADRHIAEAEQWIAGQAARVERLAAAGHETAEAENLLLVLTAALATMRAHRAQIVRELGGAA